MTKVAQDVSHDGFCSEKLLEPGGSSVEARGYESSDDFLPSNFWGMVTKGMRDHLLRWVAEEHEAPR